MQLGGRLEGKVAVITGAGSGIGAATARRFAAEGAVVVVNDIDPAGGEAVAAEIRSAGGEAWFLRADVSRPEEVQGLVEETTGRFGRLDILHNNAFFNRMGLTGALSPEDWRRSMAVTLDGTFYGMHAALPLMARQGGGAIVNTASVSGLAGDYGMSAYNAAKAGVINLTRTAAIEYARHGVRVNAVCPGPIATPPLERLLARSPAVRDALLASLPQHRLGRPEEIASIVLFLASDEASLVNGAVVTADGGLSAWTGHPPLAPDLLEQWG
jgi:meso-butanediol dehydrogenase/(S,S)-butanediol dehydrogenase/diacetyl reductase